MPKLKVDELEATSTNTNLKLTPKGTGILEAKGATNDATLQLNCSDNSHGVKLKAPSDSASQNYTLVLPDNQIAQDKLLKVKSITGSGATAVGQLEYADNPIPSNPVFSASNLTSGNVPSARLGTFPATAGAGFKFISRFHPNPSNAYGSVEFTVDNNLVSKAEKDAIVLHCLPAYRAKEITAQVFESEKSRIFEQAENRLHAQQALLSCLLE